ncbi:DUF6011 domain-containing protein [Amycolatopsis echigonensis]|uniref:Uncharacterized protein n=1 Tax=Amycolatopsis echigonensis TaxID=2576905 RepID=A0A8E2BA65_9PSEU|nr:DUF6011 domain-containing protein [Amycolatopsis echigonensis]MBB2506010.1 hypothetical protein [Amycolatopsis echigonensis]
MAGRVTAPAVCERCHRPLRDELSKQRKYGPVCYRREFGPPAPKPRGGTSIPAAARPSDQHPVDPDQIPLPLEVTVTTNEPPRAIEIVPIWQENPCARWMVFAPSHDVNDGSGWDAGVVDIDADARTGTVEIGGDQYTAAEARAIAQAIFSAADHAERFATRSASLLFELTGAGQFPEIDGLPTEQQRVIRGALQAAGDRWRKQAPAADSVSAKDDGRPAATA